MTAPSELARVDDERYGTIETDGGETIVSDRKTPDAWIRSDRLVDCEN